MIATARGEFFADLLTTWRSLFRVDFPMRQALRIRVEFKPSRLSTQYLRSAYELVAPVVQRVVEQPVEDDTRSASGRRSATTSRTSKRRRAGI